MAVLAVSQACGKAGSTESKEAEADNKQVESGNAHGKKELEWLTGATMDKAMKQAKKEDKKILLDFTGSDWCPPCIKLHNDVFVTKEFADFAKENLVLVKLDFPRNKKLPKPVSEANEELQKKFGVRALPTIVLLGKEGETLGRTEGYAGGGPKAFIKKLNQFAANKPAKEQAEG